MKNNSPDKKLIIITNAAVFFFSHRLPIALAAQKQGYETALVSTDNGKKEAIEANGIQFIEVKFDRAGKNPFKELSTIYGIRKAFRKFKPDVVHLVSIKPCIYGSIAAKLSGVKSVVNAITGLGYSFTSSNDSFFQNFLLKLFKYSLSGNRNTHFVFQNNEDAQLFIKLNGIQSNQWTLIKGSGVDLEKFCYAEEPASEKIKIVLPARMLYDKGIKEFIQAAKILQKELEGKAEFLLAGSLDPGYLAGVPEKELKESLIEGYISWLGYSEDIYTVLKDCHIVAFPSYREGLPKSLIDACAVGRPIVTTDTIGCRDCVQDGVNGFLVPVKDAEMLAERIRGLVQNKEMRMAMGKKSRQLAEEEFSVTDVVDKHLAIYERLINNGK